MTQRVAIYTRKSTSEGLDQAFNTLDAQREAVEAYVTSQVGEGWVALPERYDDGGYTGANADRPAFQRLLAAVEAGEVDIVAVYKIDRLSRSLADFTRTIELFEQHEVSFVSITQQFNTASSLGKLTLNILMSFAQFERELISERTRDKILATRRRGAWTGGPPVLGYDVVDKQLVVNDEEAAQVREIFRRFLAVQSITGLVAELSKNGHRTKSYESQNGRRRGGRRHTRASVRRLLQNPIYTGRLRVGESTVEGDHDAIVDPNTFTAVNALFRSMDCNPNRARSNSLLAGLVVCGQCGENMIVQSTKKGARRYRYYVCKTQVEAGAQSCRGSRVAANTVEQPALEQVRQSVRNPLLVLEALRVASGMSEEDQQRLTLQAETLDTEVTAARAAQQKLFKKLARDPAQEHVVAKLTTLQEHLESLEREHRDVRRAKNSPTEPFDAEELQRLVGALEPLWDELTAPERHWLVTLVVERVVYHGRAHKLEIELRTARDAWPASA